MFAWLPDAVPLVFFHSSHSMSITGSRAVWSASGSSRNRFRSVAEHGSFSWSALASYRVSNDAQRHVYVSYVRKLAAAASRLAELGRYGDGTYRRLGGMELVCALAGGILPAQVRRALRPRHARAGPDSQGLPTAQDELPAHSS